MIVIKKPKLEVSDKGSRITADIVVGGKSYPLWFAVEAKYAPYLCYERSDAFVLAVLLYALRHSEDISCEVPMTDRLYEQLTEQFLTAFNKVNGCSVKILAETAPEVEHPAGGDRVGSGISCGVDSLHVFAAHPEITTACIWSAGVGSSIKDFNELLSSRFSFMKQRSSEFAKNTHREFLAAETNYDGRSVPGLQWTCGFTSGNLFCVFALQKLWKKYYIASGYGASEYKFKLDDLNGDPSHFEYFLFPFCSLSKIQIRIDGAECDRVDKVRDLSAYEPAYNYLNVCWGGEAGLKNCTNHCTKCVRTLLEIDACGAIDKFGKVFDIEYYHKYRHEYLAEYYRGRIQKDPFAIEIIPYFDSMRFTTQEKLKALWIVAKKMLRKILRFGRTNTNYNSFSLKG